MDLSTRSVATACVAALIAVAAYLGTVFLVVSCVLLAGVVAYGWPLLLDQRKPNAARAVVGLAGVGAVATVTATPDEPVLRYVPIVLALCVVLAFGVELFGAGGRSGVVDSLIGTVSGVVVAVSCAGWIAAGRTDAGANLVVTCAVALAVASAASAIRMPQWATVGATILVAVGAGAGVGQILPGLTLVSGAVSGAVAGLLVAALHALFDRLPEARGWWGALTAAALPVAVGGTLIFVVGRVLG